MRAVVQRVRSAQVSVGGEVACQMGEGLLALVGVGQADTAESAAALAHRIVNLRIFGDESDRLNRSQLIVGMHHRDQDGVRADGPLDLYRVDLTLGIHTHRSRSKPHPFEPGKHLGHRGMLHRARRDFRPAEHGTWRRPCRGRGGSGCGS